MSDHSCGSLCPINTFSVAYEKDGINLAIRILARKLAEILATRHPYIS